MLGEWTPFVVPFVILWDFMFAALSRGIERVAWSIAGLGASSNFVVIAVNNWKMPVLGRTEVSGIHVPLTADSNLWFLSNIIGGASVGDIFVILGIVLLFMRLFRLLRT